MRFEIRYANGDVTRYTDTYDESIELLESQYPDGEIGHDGDISEGGCRTLAWSCEEDSEGDDGKKAVASIYAIDEAS